jgi:penicillin-binding protein 1C
LANRGTFNKLYYLVEDSAKSAETTSELISPGACYLTLEMLKDVKRPGIEFYWREFRNQTEVAWKTGTSYGQKDGWAIGVNPQWTIAVWVGNFDGEGNANLSGARCAGPILFEIFNYLPKNPYKNWFKKPENGLKQIALCLNTGFVAGEYCEKKVLVDAPLHMKPMKICPYHRQIYVSSDEKYRVCSLCWHSGLYKKSNFLVYPPDLRFLIADQWYRKRGLRPPFFIVKAPPHLR